MNAAAEQRVARRFQPEPELVDRVRDWLEQRDELTPLLTAFGEELPRGRLRRSFQDLTARLAAGAGAAELCATRSRVSTLLPLLACDASQGDIAGRLNRVLGESLRDDQQRRRRRRMMAYPAALIGLAFVVMAFLSITVTPMFKNIFDEFGLELPAMTLFVLAVSGLLLSHPVLVAAAIAALMAVVYFGWRGLMGQAPLPLGKLIASFTSGNSRSVASTAAFARRLAEGLAARLPMPAALRTAGETSPSLFLRRIAHKLADENAAAETEAETEPEAPLAPLRSAAWLPATMLHLLDQQPADDQATPRRLHDYADLLAERVESRFEWSTGIVAQAFVAIVGGVVGMVLIALLLPLVRLIEGLT